MSVALETAQIVGFPLDRIVLFNVKGISDQVNKGRHETVSSLLEFGLRNKTQFVERKLAPGEGKTKLAFLSFSSGTTGRPKVPEFVSLCT